MNSGTNRRQIVTTNNTMSARKRRGRVVLTAAAAAASLGSFGSARLSYGQFLQFQYNGGTYNQTFDSLPSSGTFSNPSTAGPFDLASSPYNASGMTGWEFMRFSGSTTRFAVNDGSSGTGSAYDFGLTNDSDRSLGMLASSSNVSGVGLVLLNNTANTYTQFNLSFLSEQWRNGQSSSSGQKLTFSYALGAPDISDTNGTFNFASNLDAMATVSGGPVSGQALNGHAAANQTLVSGGVTGISWGPGTTLVIRWKDADDTGNDNAIALGNLNFSATFGARDLTWNPAPTTWNSTNTNWLTNTNTATAFANGDNANFTDTGVGLVTVNAGGVTAGNINVSNNASTYTFAGGPIGGIGVLTKTNGGTLVLSASNSYSGGTAINGGTVVVNNDNQLGNGGSASFDTGTLQTTASISANRSFVFNAGGGTIDTSGFNSTLAGSVLGTGSLTKIGPGDLRSTGAWSNSRVLGISAGSVTLAQTSGTVEFDGPASDTGAFVGDLNIVNAIRVNINNGFITGGGTINILSSGAALSQTGPGTTVIGNRINLPSSGEAIIGSTGVNNILQIDGVIAGAADVRVTSSNTGAGTGKTIFNGNNTYTGNTILAGAYNGAASPAGQLIIGHDNAINPLGSLTIGSTITGHGGIFDLNGFNQSVTSLSSANVPIGGISNNSGITSTFTITGNATTTFAGTIGVLSATNFGGTDNIALNLSTTHTGSLLLTGASTYTGLTTVHNGTLLVNGSLGNTAVSIDAAGKFGGSGSVGTGSATVDSFGTLLPGGDGGGGTLTINGALTLENGSTIKIDLTPANPDQVAVVGSSVTKPAGTVTISAFDLGGAFNGTYPILTYPAGISAMGGFTLTPHAGWSLSQTATELDLIVTGGHNVLTWNGNVNGSWNTTGTANWTGTSTTYGDGDNVTFDNNATGATTIVIQAGGVAPGEIHFNNSTKPYTFTGGPIKDPVSGPLAIVVDSGGTVTLNNSNSYSGAVSVINNSTLGIGNNNALGATSGVTVNSGTIFSSASMTTDRNISFTGPASIDTNGNNLTLTGVVSGAGALTKSSGGTLVLATPNGATTFTGGTTISAGTVRVTTSNTATAVTGLGTGGVTVQNGGTLDIATYLGILSNDGASFGTGTTVNLNDGATMQGTGDARIQGTLHLPSSGTVTLRAATAADSLITGTALRNDASGSPGTATVNVTGSGIVRLGSGTTSNAANGTQFAASMWNLSMGSGGVLSVGPILAGGAGEVLNGLGYAAPNPGGSGTYSGSTSPITINSGILAIGADAANARAGTTINSFRSPITSNGTQANPAVLASTGREYDPGSGDAVSATGVDANIVSDITMNASSVTQVRLTDPAAALNNPGGVGGARSLTFGNDANAVETNGGNVSSNINWGSDATLRVLDPGAGNVGGALNIVRTAGTITVANTTAQMQIDANAAVNLGGSVDALHDSSSLNNVKVVNQGTFNVTQGTKNIGNLSGAGTNNVSSGATLVVNSTSNSIAGVVQGSGTLVKNGTSTLGVTRLGTTASPLGGLTINAGHVEVGSVNIGGQNTANTSVLSSAPVIGATAQLDLGDHAMIINYAAGDMSHSTRDAIRNLLKLGRNGGPGQPGAWNGNGGITSTFAHNNGNGFNLAIGYGDNEDIALVRGSGSYTAFGGQTVASNTVLVQMTRGADATLDGVVDAQDVTILGSHFNKPNSGQWVFGDFDYSGTCDATDVTTLGSTFGKTTPTLSPAQMTAEFGSAFTQAFEGGQAGAVPEPASLTLLGLGGVALIGRRRRKTKA